jgi:nucleoside-diphosphate-sugar epimerase
MSLKLYQVDHDAKHLCIIIGLGLIGRTISHFLDRKYSYNKQFSNSVSDWKRPVLLNKAIKNIITTLQPNKLNVIWTAGKAGFSASDNDMKVEYDFFVDVIRSLSVFDIDTTINFLSSAGGTYETMGFVSELDSVDPIRPYAVWKLKQEAVIKSYGMVSRIYRISSAYGYKVRGGRSGMINALIDCALLKKIATIYANQNTLRDYIFINDIADYIVENIVEGRQSLTTILASGRPVSINTLLNMVETITRKPIKAIYVDTNSNSNNIVFDEHLIPPGLVKTSLEEGVRLLYARATSG